MFCKLFRRWIQRGFFFFSSKTGQCFIVNCNFVTRRTCWDWPYDWIDRSYVCFHYNHRRNDPIPRSSSSIHLHYLMNFVRLVWSYCTNQTWILDSTYSSLAKLNFVQLWLDVSCSFHQVHSTFCSWQDYASQTCYEPCSGDREDTAHGRLSLLFL